MFAKQAAGGKSPASLAERMEPESHWTGQDQATSTQPIPWACAWGNFKISKYFYDFQGKTRAFGSCQGKQQTVLPVAGPK